MAGEIRQVPNPDVFVVGTGTSVLMSGVLSSTITEIGTTAVTTEEDLLTVQVPANVLSSTGRGLRVTAWGRGAANTNSKTIRLRAGASLIAVQVFTTSSAGWRMVAEVVRISSGAQTSCGVATVSSTTLTQQTTLALDTSTAITIRVTGQNGVASANDIIASGVRVELV
jgi:hypothetical protein